MPPPPPRLIKLAHRRPKSERWSSERRGGFLSRFLQFSTRRRRPSRLERGPWQPEATANQIRRRLADG